MSATLSGPYAAMAGVAGKSLSSPPTAEPPTATERSCLGSVRASSRQGKSDEAGSLTQPLKQDKRYNVSDRVNWGSEHHLVKDPKHLGHIMAPDPESAVRKLGKRMPPNSMKDLWRLRDRGTYPARASAGETLFNHTDTPDSALLAAAYENKFSHFGNSWSSLNRAQSAGSIGFTRSQSFRSPTNLKGTLMNDAHHKASTSIGWRPGAEDSHWSSPADFKHGQPWKNGLYESPVTKYFHNHIATGMVNATLTRSLMSR
jgi:hypothetical protein